MQEQTVGIPIVVTGPSGVGKGTLIRHLLDRDAQLTLSISMTTRSPRPGERDGIDYFFVSEETFHSAVREQELVEWAQVYGNCYGTPRAHLEERFALGYDVLLDIDIQGAAAVRCLFRQAILIYIAPPSLDALKQRLQNRPKSECDDISRRLQEAADEMRMIGLFDYRVINHEDQVEAALDQLHAIIQADRLRIQRQTQSPLACGPCEPGEL